MLNAATQTHSINRATLWVDRVGSFLLCLKPRVRIGGPVENGSAADVSLMANLSRHHATIFREGETYLLTAHGPASLAGRTLSTPAILHDGQEIVLGTNVRLRFRIPSPMSNTARLEFVSDHRPQQSMNSVILMDETCLLGPGDEHHVPCAVWKEPVVLFKREETFWCKARSGISVSESSHNSSVELTNGAVVTANDGRFRLEWL
jgi:hypothetical protein